MKRMKKLTSVLLALAMVLSLTVFASAADASATVTNQDSTDIAVTSFTSTDTALDGKVVTLTSDGSALDNASIDATGYTATVSGTTVTITKDEDSSTAGTLVVSFTNLSGYGYNGITIALTVPDASPAGGGGSNEPTGVTTDTETKDALENAEGSGSGTGKKEGGDPSKVISVILPTVSENAFDMILDPHELLKDTAYARLGGADKVNFNDATNHLFFNQGVSSNKVQYGKDSVELSIINKSQIDVWIALNVAVTTGDSTVAFAEDATALGNAEGAAMNLTLKNTPVKGENTAQNTVWDATADDKPSTQVVGTDGTATINYKIPTIDVFKRTYSNGAYSYIVDTSKSDGSNAQFNSTKFQLTGEINKKDAWDAVGADDIALTLTWKATKDEPTASGGSSAPADADPTVVETRKATAMATNAASATDAQKTVLTYTLGSGDKAMASVQSVSFTNASNNPVNWNPSNANVTVDTDAKTITIANISAINGGSGWKVVFVADDGTTTKDVSFTMHD